MLLSVWPFGQLPYLWALAAWSLLWLAFYLWASVGWRTDATILVVALLPAPASYINISGGQNGFLTGALLIGGLRLLGSKPILAGICFRSEEHRSELRSLMRISYAVICLQKKTVLTSQTNTILNTSIIIVRTSLSL